MIRAVFVLDRLRRRSLPYASLALGAFTLALYAVETSYGGGHAGHVLRELGGSSRDLVARGGWHRLLAAAFLHADAAHLAANAWSFAILAPLVERLWGAARLVVLYVLAAIGGNALSAAVGHSPLTVGASGAIFGLVGFLGAALHGGRQTHELRTVLGSLLGRSLLLWGTYALASGFLPESRTDNLAHVGGLVTGVLLGLVLTSTDRPRAPLLLLATTLALAIPGAFAGGWLEARARQADDEVVGAIEEAVAARRWDRAVALCEEALVARPRSPEVPRVLYWQGVAFRKSLRPEEARLALERSFRLRPHVLPAYLLAALAISRSDTTTALEWAERGDSFGEKPAVKIAVAERFLDAGLPDAALVALERARATGTLDVVDRRRVAAIESAARARR